MECDTPISGPEHNVAAADVPGAGPAGGPLLRQPPRVHRRPHREPGADARHRRPRPHLRQARREDGQPAQHAQQPPLAGPQLWLGRKGPSPHETRGGYIDQLYF